MVQAPDDEGTSNGVLPQLTQNTTFEAARAQSGDMAAAAESSSGSGSNGNGNSSRKNNGPQLQEAGVSANASRNDSSGAMSPGNPTAQSSSQSAAAGGGGGGASESAAAGGGGGAGGAGSSRDPLDSICLEVEAMPTADEEYYARVAFEAMSGQSTPAMLRLGKCYIEGRGIRQDPETGVNWIRRAAKLGDADALNALGELWGAGEPSECGFHVDKAKAIKYYRRAAECGSRDAMVNLGLAYADGVEVPRDGLEACLWLSKASHLGSSRAQAGLGRLYLSGAEGLDPEPASGVFYLRSAVRAGNPEAAMTLGECYKSGLGTVKNRKKALDLFGMAAKGGVPEAVAALETEGLQEGDADDRDAAWRCLEEGAANGHQSCREALERLSGTRPAPSPKPSANWQKAAAAAGVATATAAAAKSPKLPPIAPRRKKDAAAASAAAASAAAAVAASAVAVTRDEGGDQPSAGSDPDPIAERISSPMSTIGELPTASSAAAASKSERPLFTRSQSLRPSTERRTQRRSDDSVNSSEMLSKRRNSSVRNLVMSLARRRSTIDGPGGRPRVPSGAEQAQLQYLSQDNYRLQKELELTQRKLSSMQKLSRSMDNVVQRFTLRIMALEDQVRSLGREPVVPAEAATGDAIPGTPVASVPLTDPRLKKLFNSSPGSSPRSPRHSSQPIAKMLGFGSPRQQSSRPPVTTKTPGTTALDSNNGTPSAVGAHEH